MDQDIQQLMHIKEEVPDDEQDWSPSSNQEDPEPPHMKEEQEELSINPCLEEADLNMVPFICVPVKSEDDEEETRSSQLHQKAKNKEESDGEDCGEHLQTHTDEQSKDSEDMADSDDWTDSSTPESHINKKSKPPGSRSAGKMETQVNGENCRRAEPDRNQVHVKDLNRGFAPNSGLTFSKNRNRRNSDENKSFEGRHIDATRNGLCCSIQAKRRCSTGKGSGAKAPARRAQKLPAHPPREESSDSDVLEVPQENVPTPEEGAPSQAAQRKEKKPRGAFKLKDQEEEATVIEWVQENRLLWDQKDQNFKKKNQKDRLWAEKAQELGYEAQYLKTWYTDLRDFNTKLLRVQSADGARMFTAREQWVMGQFQFLKERIRRRRHHLHSVQSSAAAKAPPESGTLEDAEQLAVEERRFLDDVDRDSASSRRSSKRQRGSQEEVEDQYLKVLRKELAESQKRLTALQEREPDDERAAYMKYVSKVVCKSTEDAYEDFQRVFMNWQARWKAQRQQQQRYQPQQYQQRSTQHQWYPGSSESTQQQPPPHQWGQPTPQMQATSIWGSQSTDFMTHAYPSAAGGPCPSGSTSLAPPVLQHLASSMSMATSPTDRASCAPTSTSTSLALATARPPCSAPHLEPAPHRNT